MDDLGERLQRALGDAYLVERELTPGGMSRLFVALERSLNREIVVKVLPPDAAAPVSLERFRREAELLARLQHTHIVPLIGFGAGEGLMYFTMPLVRGESLRDRLARAGPLPVGEAIVILREMADAVAHAHRHGVIHRDIKPANVLLADGHAVLSDFGIARFASTTAAGLTSTGISVGTLGYMAPEQLMGGSAVDERADVYSLGVVGYEMLTGQLPVTGAPAAPEHVRPEIPPAVSRTVLKAIASEPSARFASAAEFRDALADTRASRGRRARWLVGAGAAACVAIAATLVSIYLKHGATTGDAVIAVAPFDVLRPDLQLWKEGIVDVLARNLDGMGALRAVPASTVLHAWRGRADAASAQALGDATHSSFVVYGSLQGNGDSVRAVATIYDVAGRRRITDVERHDLLGNIDRLADSLTVALVRALPGTGASAALRQHPFGTRSIAALKEFLQGEQAYRRSTLDSADAHFARAIELDTGFALAYHRRANTLAWSRGLAGSINEMAFAAVARNHGLSARDSLLIVGDSVRRALDAHLADEPALLARLLAIVSEVTTRFPADAEGWLEYGDALFHYPGKPTDYPSAERVLALFDRAIEADSGLGEAYTHSVNLALQRGDVERARRYLSAALRLSPSGVRASSLELALAMTRATPGSSGSSCAAFVDPATSIAMMTSTRTLIGDWALFNGVIVSCLDRMVHQPLAKRAVLDPDGELPSILTTMRRARGQIALAAQANVSRNDPFDLVDGAALATVGLVNADSVLALTHGVLRDSSAWARFIIPVFSFFWASRRDTAALATVADRVAQRPARHLSPSAERRQRSLAAAEIGYLALARSDTAAAIRAFESAPYYDGFTEQLVRVLPLSWLYEAMGRQRDAFRLLNMQSPQASDYSPWAATVVVDRLRLARLADRLGERETAAHAYALVVDAWRDADPVYKSLYTEAINGLRRTAGDAAVARLVPNR